MTAALHLAELDLLDRDDLTVDDVADLPEDLRFELINGRLVLSPHALPIHQIILQGTSYALERHCPAEFVVNIEQAIRMGPHSELRPDVMVLHEEGAGGSPILAADVLLVVEIVSKSSKLYDRKDKFDWYAEVGIPAYWIIDPLATDITLTQFARDRDGAYRQLLQTADLVTVEQPWKTTLDLPGWTRRRDRIQKNARPR